MALDGELKTTLKQIEKFNVRKEHHLPGYLGVEEKCGYIKLVNVYGVPEIVFVKVYRTASNHFLLICKERNSEALGVVNLRNTCCQRVDHKDKCCVILKQSVSDNWCDTLEFITVPEEIGSWVAALTSNLEKRVRKCSLPILREDYEI